MKCNFVWPYIQQFTESNKVPLLTYFCLNLWQRLLLFSEVTMGVKNKQQQMSSNNNHHIYIYMPECYRIDQFPLATPVLGLSNGYRHHKCLVFQTATASGTQLFSETPLWLRQQRKRAANITLLIILLIFWAAHLSISSKGAYMRPLM